MSLSFPAFSTSLNSMALLVTLVDNMLRCSEPLHRNKTFYRIHIIVASCNLLSSFVGFAEMEFNLMRGRRWMAYHGYLRDIMGTRKALTVKKYATVTKVALIYSTQKHLPTLTETNLGQ